MTNFDKAGRAATTPTDFPFSAWKQIVWRVLKEFSDDRIPLVAASAAFYALLALVPFVASLVSIYGLAFDPQGVAGQMQSLSTLVPEEVLALLTEQLERLTKEPLRTLGITFVLTLAMSIWSASAATKAVMEGLNIVYDERENRGFIGLSATALFITVIGTVVVAILIGVTVAMPLVIEKLTVHPLTARLGGFVGLAVIVWVGLIALYRWGPSRADAKWRWLAPGTFIAVAGLVVFSIAFSWFARSFAGYAGYGSIGAVIAFMTWAWIGMMIVLLGAEFNAEMEHQTARDTTTGRPLPIGLRGAVMADNVSSEATAGRRPEDDGARAASLTVPIAVVSFIAGAAIAAKFIRR